MKTAITSEAIAAQAAFIKSALQVEPLTIHEARDIAASLHSGARRLVDGNGVLTPDDDLQWHISAVKQAMIEIEARWRANDCREVLEDDLA